MPNEQIEAPTFKIPTMVPLDWGKFWTPVTKLAVVKKTAAWFDKNIKKHINATGGRWINPTTEAHIIKYPKKLWSLDHTHPQLGLFFCGYPFVVGLAGVFEFVVAGVVCGCLF